MRLTRTAGVLLLAGLAATACTAGGEPASAPEPTPTASVSAGPERVPSAGPTPAPRPAVTGGAGSDGLTVRYQGPDGSTRTLRVEDFPR